MLFAAGLVCRELGLETGAPDLAEWKQMVQKIHSRSKTVTIGLVGKYVPRNIRRFVSAQHGAE